MSIHELSQKKHSVRSFKSRKLAREVMEAILEAADSAPSSGGLKARDWYIVDNDQTKARLVEAAFGQDFIAQASVVLVFGPLVPGRLKSMENAE